MYVCNYCKRVLKDEYEKCPGCGGSSFKTKSYLGEVIISDPPKDGYKININNYVRKIRNLNIAIFITIIVTILLVILFFPFIIMPNLFGILFIIFFIKKKKESKNDIKRINKLCKKGILVKGMKYKVVNTGTMVAGHYYKCIEVNYKNANGIEIPLYSETKYDIEKYKKDTVDLLIDPDDYSNYFIDYEIY